MGNLLEAVRRLRTDMKLSKGRCANVWCDKPLPDIPRSFRGIKACSQDCADTAWQDSF